MKRIGNLYSELISDRNLGIAILEVNKTHKWLPKHRKNKTVILVESDMKSRVKELREIIENGFIPSPLIKKRRWDKSACKWRNICEPKLWPDQYIHHALIQVLEPVMMRGMDKFCCGSIRNRGIHYGMKAIKKWMKEDINGTKYCLELDIHHFYDSLSSDVVMTRLKQLVKDYKVLDLAERIMCDGVQIGVYCSQWFANTTLQPLDHMIREGNFGITHYLRYMDNFTIFSNNKRKLRNLFVEIKKWLNEFELDVKCNWQIFPTSHRMPVALGYRYGHGYTLLKKRNLFRLKKQLNKYYYKKKRHKRISKKMAASILSRVGQLKHCNNTLVYQKIYHGKIQRDLKCVIREYSKKEQLQLNKK